MKCDNCGDSKATIHQIHVVNSEIKHMQLCEACAKDDTTEVDQGKDGVSEAFSGLKDAQEGDADECPQCGTGLAEIRRTNQVGCEQCYETFRDQFEAMVHRIHGADQHVGNESETRASSDSSAGLGRVAPSKKKKMLEKRLEKRVEEENYERAAELRDRIAELDEESNHDATS